MVEVAEEALEVAEAGGVEELELDLVALAGAARHLGAEPADELLVDVGGLVLVHHSPCSRRAATSFSPAFAR